MARPNIELYEALKKDVSQEAARMIAEAVPKAEGLATNGDLAAEISAVKSVIADLKSEVVAVEARLKSYIDSRLLRFTAAIVIPMTVTMLGTLGALITLGIKL